MIYNWLRKIEVVLDDTTAQQWAEQHFGSAHLRHRRRTRRLVRSAAAIATLPEKPFNQVFDWNALRAFYNLCDQEVATLAAIQQPHWERTRQAMGQHQLVLILHDTSELDFTAPPALQGAGPIGDGQGQGFLQHNSVAVLPKPRQVLGLAYQQLRVRQEAPAGEHTQQRKRRRRESELWREGITACGRPPEGCSWVAVGDRGSDIYEALVASQAVGHAFRFRVTQNRPVWTSAAQAHLVGLRDFAASWPSQGGDRVEMPGRGEERPGRQPCSWRPRRFGFRLRRGRCSAGRSRSSRPGSFAFGKRRLLKESNRWNGSWCVRSRRERWKN